MSEDDHEIDDEQDVDVNQLPEEDSIFNLEDDGRLADPKAFVSFLSEMDGKPVTIDASKAPLVTSLLLQVMIAGEAHWRANGLKFDVINMSDPFKTSLSMLGWQPT